jgi:hypothetical protein
MTWIVVTITRNIGSRLSETATYDRNYFGPFDTEHAANKYAAECQKYCFCSFSVRLEKPIVVPVE